MLARLRESVTGTLAHLEVQLDAPASDLMPRSEEEDDWRQVHDEPEPAFAGNGAAAQSARPARRASGPPDPADPSSWGKVARNAPCPCGSGKKYKHCHGRLA